MSNPLQNVLDFAVARSREAEVFFKEWAPGVNDPEVRELFAEVVAGERGRTEMLSRMIPEEMIASGGEVPDVADWLIEVEAVEEPMLRKAVRVAIRRKCVTASLYERIARLEGEACSFFQAMADEDRRTICDLEAYAERLAPDG